jgi:lipopolysaccharide transport system ATP-binding protein
LTIGQPISGSDSPSGPRIAVVGTFDVQNFGDLLFPLITSREFRERAPAADLHLYSYHDKRDGWPYAVRSLTHLAGDLPHLDLVIVGAGHLVRFDKEVAPGYGPPTGIHHPTGYWLMPSLLSATQGVPVAWNSVSASPETPEWAIELLRLAILAASYVTVRDEPSLAELRRVAGPDAITLVPDIAFGVQRLLPSRPSDELQAFLQECGVAGPYIIAQPSPHLERHAHQVAEAIRVARRNGFAVLELPISPVLGDQTGMFGDTTARSTRWPEPLLLAEVIANAEGVIARSLHLSVVALACGVPVHRHRSASRAAPAGSRGPAPHRAFACSLGCASRTARPRRRRRGTCGHGADLLLHSRAGTNR